MSRKKIFPVEELSGDSRAIFEALNEESALAAVLIGASFLDNCLASMLEASFIRSRVTKKLLDPSRGAIGTFSSRSDLARCLGLIDKRTYQDLEIIGGIRNLFAHSHLTLDFANQEVISKCNSLKYAEPILKVMASHYIEGDINDIATPNLASPRDRFNITVALISQKLLVDALGIRRKAKTTKKIGDVVT